MSKIMEQLLNEEKIEAAKRMPERGNCKGFRFAIEYSEMMWSRY